MHMVRERRREERGISTYYKLWFTLFRHLSRRLSFPSPYTFSAGKFIPTFEEAVEVLFDLDFDTEKNRLRPEELWLFGPVRASSTAIALTKGESEERGWGRGGEFRR